MSKIKILQIGAGSMGSRRIRDLSRRDDVQVALFDSSAARRERAASTHGIQTFAELEEAMAWAPRAMSISTPPDRHEPYVRLALDRGLDHFCEANIWTPLLADIEQAVDGTGIVAAASCSLHFLPIVKELKRLVREELGAVHGYQMALNTYMPDWHPGEGTEYYARHRNTSAGREMVPFELLWLNEVFGLPIEASGVISHGNQSMPVREDTWAVQMRLANGGNGQLMVLMGSPAALRAGCCFGDAGQVCFDLISGEIRRSYRVGGTSDSRQFGAMRDVLEDSYAAEMSAFVDALLGRAPWPQGYRAAAIATAVLAAAEQSALTGRREPVRVEIQPAELIENAR